MDKPKDRVIQRDDVFAKQSPKLSRKQKHILLAVFLVSVLLIVLVFGAYYFFKADPPVARSSNEISAELAGQALELYAAGSYEAAHEVLLSGIEDESLDPGDRSKLAQTAANIELERNEIEAAIALAEKAVKLKPGIEVYDQLAALYEDAGKTEQAIQYYQLAIDATNAAKPEGYVAEELPYAVREAIMYYELKINDLKGL